MFKNQKGNTTAGIALFGLAIGFLALVLFTIMWGWQHFRLWKVEYAGQALEIEKTYVGKAILAEAEHSRMARVEAAKAEKESAQLTADAIKIVGEMAKQYPEYRQQEFILGFTSALENGTIEQVVYVPTEAMIPITEAGKR